MFIRSEAQIFKFNPELKEQMTDSVKSRIFNVCTKLVAELQFSFNFNTSDIKNDKPRTTKTKTVRTPKQQLDSLTKLLKNNFTDANNNFLIGMLYLNAGNNANADKYFKESLNNCEEAIKSMPDSIDYYMKKAQINKIYNNLNETIRTFESAMTNVKDNYSAHVSLIIEFLNIGNFDKARKLCNDGIKKYPEDEIFYFYHTLTDFFELVKSDKSEEELNKALSDNKFLNVDIIKKAVKKYPNNFILKTTYYLLRQYLLTSRIMFKMESVSDIENYKFSDSEQKEYNEIKKYNLKALKSKSRKNDYLLYYALGTLETVKGNFAKSIEYLNLALNDRKKYEQSDSETEIYNNLVAAHMLNNDTISAIKVINDKIESLQKTDDYNLLATMYLKQNKLQKAEQVVTKMSKKRIHNINTVRAMSLIYLQRGKYDKARGVLKEIYKYKPQDPDTDIISGVIEIYAGKIKKGYDYFEKSFKLNPNNSKLTAIADAIFKAK